MSLTRNDIGVWLISLPRAVERRRRMETQLARMALPFTLFDGVDGRARIEELLPLVDVVAFERNLGRRLLPGDVGCYCSHLDVWQAFLASDKQVALVLEDDVEFHDEFLEAIDLAITHGEAWDMLKLNRIRAKLPLSQRRLGCWQLNAYLGPATGTGAYLVHRATVERLLKAMLPIRRTIDHELNRFFEHDFRLFGMEPFPSHVDDGGVSLITGADFGDVNKFPKYRRLPYYGQKLMNYLRRLYWLASHGMLRRR